MLPERKNLVRILHYRQNLMTFKTAMNISFVFNFFVQRLLKTYFAPTEIFSDLRPRRTQKRVILV
jgi:hypothetical protein